MQQESNAKNSKISKISIQSLGSNFSNFSFLKDAPAANRQSYRDSLKYYMSVESDKKSDIYENLIGEDVKMNSIHSSALGRSGKPDSNKSYINSRGSYDQRKNGQYFNSDYEIKNALPNSNISDQNNKNLYSSYHIMHTCLCIDRCQKECPCYTANDQCILGFCCPNCIEEKNIMLERLQQEKYKEKQYLSTENGDQFKPCTCKKTKCNKKYCACYAAGRKCTNLCTCDECTNCEFYDYVPTPQTKPKTYIDQEYENNKMPEKMDFQPCQFPQL